MTKYSRHIEGSILLIGLILMALMDPYTQKTTWCLLEHAGLFCPGEGLGHSIAFIFRGELKLALQANLMGPIAVVILSVRIIKISMDLFKEHKRGFNGVTYVKDSRSGT